MATDTQEPNDKVVIEGEVIEVKTPEAALAVMNPGEYGKQLMEPYVKQLTAARRKFTTAKFDIKTKDGMTTAKQLKKLFVTIRTTADEAKANAKRPIDAAGAAILAEYKPIETGAKAEEKKIADIITAEEKRLADEKQAKLDAERVRTEAIEARLAHIRNIPGTMVLAESTKISETIETLLAKQLDPKMYDEHLEAAAEAMIETVDKLREHLAAALAREEATRVAKENAEKLARLEAEQAERDKAAAEAKRIADEQVAAVARQAQDMQDIMAINMVANTAPGIETRAQLAEELSKVHAFDPAKYGTIQNMADMAKTLATNALQARLAQLPEEEPEPQPELKVEPVQESYVVPARRFGGGGSSYRSPAPAPAPVVPALEELAGVLARHYDVELTVAIGWMATHAAALALVA